MSRNNLMFRVQIYVTKNIMMTPGWNYLRPRETALFW